MQGFCFKLYFPLHAQRGILTQRKNLPQQNAVGPYVTLGGEHLVKDGLWRHPLEREASLPANHITGLQKTSCEEILKVWPAEEKMLRDFHFLTFPKHEQEVLVVSNSYMTQNTSHKLPFPSVVSAVMW